MRVAGASRVASGVFERKASLGQFRKGFRVPGRVLILVKPTEKTAKCLAECSLQHEPSLHDRCLTNTQIPVSRGRSGSGSSGDEFGRRAGEGGRTIAEHDDLVGELGGLVDEM